MLQLVLLIGKFLFLLVLYLFVYMVVRSATRDLRMASQSIPAPAAVSAYPPAATLSEDTLPGGSLPDAGVVAPGGWLLAAASVPRMRNGTRIPVPAGGGLVAGRSAEAGLQLDDTFVSGHHARFVITQEGLVVEDLGSTNGTFVNGAEIGQPTLLAPGDQVTIGDGVFVVEAVR